MTSVQAKKKQPNTNVTADMGFQILNSRPNSVHRINESLYWLKKQEKYTCIKIVQKRTDTLRPGVSSYFWPYSVTTGNNSI